MKSQGFHPGIRVLVILAALFTTSLHAQGNAEGPTTRHAYYVAEFESTVPGAIRPYSERVESTFKPFGGRFIVRGGRLEALEGPQPKDVIVVIEFDSFERAQAWYHSAAYEELKPIRYRAGNSRVYIVDGVAQS